MTVPDVFVVVREAGERTAGLARRLAEAQVGPDAVAMIREVPFAAALRRGMEIGAGSGRRWTLCLDADVLLRAGAVADLARAAEAVPEDAFGVTGLVADKLLCHRRAAGQHLYRTALLETALRTASFDPAKRRPETVVKKAMSRQGHATVATRVGMGLHDFEQSYADIFRKVFVHARKHQRFMAMAGRAWRRQAPEDADYRVALVSAAVAEAISKGTMPHTGREDESVRIDRRDFADGLDALLRPMGLSEKSAIRPEDWDEAAIGRILAANEDAPEYRAARGLIEATGENRAARIKARLRHHGPASPLWFAGTCLERSGLWLRRRLGDGDV